MPDRRLNRAAAAVGFALAALSLSVSPAAAEDTADPTACGEDQVTIVVDFNELGGQTRVTCVDGGGTAARLFDRAGFPLGTSDAPGMQGFVCTVSGLPEGGPCGRSSAYWSLWWSAHDDRADESTGAGEWAYASLGVNELTLEPGDHLGFAWHRGAGSAQPPDVALDGAGGVDAADGEEVAEGAAEPATGDTEDDHGGPATWLLVGGAVVVLGAAAVVPLRRRRNQP